ncbi:flagellar hook-associated protein FlgL [Shouchella clausii]|uniref:flagellar hook-associated protein FlgL n=1 Tax=Shouchella clausii TaxID=79880 RepID=UPI000BA7C84D|nr:flagellar hook-associated protein FlgL [Shouchella clausii]PAD90172.1 flagellar hook-associated protein 3 [Shouchella clausii]
MRVTQGMMTANSLRYSQSSYQRLSTLYDQISAQKKITRFSQDPVVAAKSMQHRQSLAQMEQYKRNVNEAHSWLNQGDTSLKEVSSILKRVRELAVTGSTDGYGEEERKNIAHELEELRNHLITVANANVNGKYIFNGSDTDNPPVQELSPSKLNGEKLDNVKITYDGQIYDYDADAGHFVARGGDDTLVLNGEAIETGTGDVVAEKDMLIMRISTNQQDVSFELQKGVEIQVNTDARKLFSDELYSDFFMFEQALLDPETTAEDLGEFISKIDAHLRNAADVHGQLGARMNRVDLMEDRLGQQEYFVKETKSMNEDLDLSEAIMKLLVAEGVHNAALAVTARIIQPSLLDFLR